MIRVAHAAANGECLIPCEIARAIAVGESTPRGSLTALEVELLQRLAKGQHIPQVCSEMNHSERTIRRRLQSAYAKLGVNNRTEAIVAAAHIGLVEPAQEAFKKPKSITVQPLA
ncbi:MAG: response regulator transcription factor [Acidimicrobiales bacterium]